MGSQKNSGRSLAAWLCPHSRFPQKIMPIPCRLLMYVYSFSRDFRLQFRVRVANLQSREEWAIGVGDGPSRKSFYRPSIVTFPLSLRVSEILPLLFSRTPLFRSSLPKIFPCSPGNRWIAFFGYKERRCWANTLCN